jgi:3-dehydroquinate dehydratase type I
MAELRLDLVGLSDAEVAKVLDRPVEFIAACRPGKFPDAERLRLLALAAKRGAAYIDVEMDSSPSFRKSAMEAARGAGAKVIISHHDVKGTPSLKSLKAIVGRARRLGADVVKVACLARTRAENAMLLALLDGADDVVVVGLGAKGRTSRLAAPLLGSQFIYAAPDEGTKTEAGQLTLAEARRFYEALGAMD